MQEIYTVLPFLYTGSPSPISIAAGFTLVGLLKQYYGFEAKPLFIRALRGLINLNGPAHAHLGIPTTSALELYFSSTRNWQSWPKLQCRCACLCLLDGPLTCIVPLLPVLSWAISPTDTTKGFWPKSFCRGGRLCGGVRKLLILRLPLGARRLLGNARSSRRWRLCSGGLWQIFFVWDPLGVTCYGDLQQICRWKCTIRYLDALEPRTTLLDSLEEPVRADAFPRPPYRDLAKEHYADTSRDNPLVCALSHPTLRASCRNVLHWHAGRCNVFSLIVFMGEKKDMCKASCGI